MAAQSTALIAQEPKDAQAKALFTARCQTCHELSTITVHRGSKSEWRDIVARMLTYGAQVTDPEKETIIDYLSVTFGPDQAVAAAGQPRAR